MSPQPLRFMLSRVSRPLSGISLPHHRVSLPLAGVSRPLARPRAAVALGAAISTLAVALALGMPAPAAQAALIETGACNQAPLSQPFAPWGDESSYELMPQGDFAGSLSQWTLGAGATGVAEGVPYEVAGAAPGHSLALRAGASAQSPYTCVDAGYPTFRFFARATSLLATIVVQVVYDTPLLGPVALPLGVVLPGGGWHPTPTLLTGSVAGGLLAGGTAQAALRFTALVGSVRLTDVFVDPRMR